MKASFRRYFLIGFLLFISTLSALAQSYTITGKVYNAETKEPLPFVPVLIKGTTIGTTTDFDGNFSITTDQKGDSLISSYVSYKRTSRPIKGQQNQEINMPMTLEGVNLVEVVVKAGENPAWRIIRNVIAHKPENNKREQDAYQYETYNKVEFDLTKIPKQLREGKLFKPIQFVFENIDSINSGEKPSLPFFITETISDTYFRSNPTRKKEVVKASKITGIENESVSQVMGDMYQNVNIYDNDMIIFGKDFVSPISDNGLFYYKYYLEDSLYIGNTRCYHIRFKPKRTQELCFSGNMWIADTTWGVKRLEMSMPKDINVNFITTASVVQEYDRMDSTWMLTKDRLVIEFNMNQRSIGFYGRKTTSYKDIVLNQPRDVKFYEFGDKIDVEEGANKKDDAYWQQHRHDSLNVREQKIYKMIDTIQSLPIYKTWVDIFTIFVSGYKKVNNFEIGPYFNLVSYNKVEGTRLRFGGRTSSKFSRWYELNGYVAYGLKDEKWKYSLGFRTFISKKPHRQLVGMTYKSDYEILGQSTNGFSQDNLFASFLRVSPLRNLTRVDHVDAWYERTWVDGFTSRIALVNRVFTPVGAARYLYYENDGSIADKGSIKNTEFRVNLRFAYKEKFISGDFTRISLGTMWPIFQLNYAKSLQNAFEGEYDYQKVVLNISDRIRLSSLLGYTDYILEGGQIFGTVPFPLLELHGGNETYIYDYMSFNMMKYYEFASDRYVSLGLFHHFEGLLFNKIPLLRKLKWREVVTGKGVIGSISDKNQHVLIFPTTLHSLNHGPYAEVSAGVENIFKVFRVDALWRLTYRDPKAINNFGVKFSFQLAF